MSAGEVDLDFDLVRATLEQIFAEAVEDDASAALAEFGVRDLIAEGGATAEVLLMHVQGRSGGTSHALCDVMAANLGTDAQASVLLPIGPAGWEGIGGKAVGARIMLDGIVVGAVQQRVITAVRSEGGAAIVRMVDLSAVDGTVATVDGLDSRLGLLRVTGTVPEGSAPQIGVGAEWVRTSTAGRVALAAELTGCTERMLELAVEHALSRQQFGVPIGSFQAVKHKLAEVAVAVDGARGAVDAAADRRSWLSGLVAKSLASRAGQLATKNCLQVLGGIGFTWEHPYHLLHRRAMVLDRLLGSAAELSAVIGRELLTTGQVPRPADLE